MIARGKAERMNRDVVSFFERHLCDRPIYRRYLLDIWQNYLEQNLPSDHFVKELTSGNRARLFQRAWEMMLARHLAALGYRLTSPAHGPDFKFDCDGRTVWVEAVSPEPKGLPESWLQGTENVIPFPHNEILLRWTAAIKEKWCKLKKYQKAGIVRDADAYVIAVNGCQLGPQSLNHGISRLPFAVEAVYCAGPLAIPIDPQTGRLGETFVTLRNTIETANSFLVPTSIFLDQDYRGISAVIACSMDRSEKTVLPFDVIHNYFASVRVPERILSSAGEEWVAELTDCAGEEISLRRLDRFGVEK